MKVGRRVLGCWPPPLTSRSMRRGFRASGHSSRTRGSGDQEEEEEKEAARKWAHLAGANAYQILGLSPSCSPHCIRDAFTKMAKLTHPDLQPASSTSAQFILVVSAYQILSSPDRRAQYDAHLQECSRPNQKSCTSELKRNTAYVNEDMEVVEWLRWYRNMAMTMVHQKEIGSRQSFTDEYRANLQEALKRACFGPLLYDDDDDEVLPKCLEAEERADTTDMEVLHLVSGRKLIGAVLQVGSMGLLEETMLRLSPLTRSQLSESSMRLAVVKDAATIRHKESQRLSNMRSSTPQEQDASAFVDLELYLYGNLVARATRSLPKLAHKNGMDEITVYLCHDCFLRDGAEESQHDVVLGRILGLNKMEDGDKGQVYSPSGEHTHVIWQFRSPWVKHMYWFKLNGKRMLCECRSTRARLPASKFWVFEPRCATHNIGGWYIEILWRDRLHDGRGYCINWAGKHLGLLHPAVYILATAYRTLDTEALRRRNKSLWSIIWDHQSLLAGATRRALRWCKLKFLSVKQYV